MSKKDRKRNRKQVVLPAFEKHIQQADIEQACASLFEEPVRLVNEIEELLGENYVKILRAIGERDAGKVATKLLFFGEEYGEEREEMAALFVKIYIADASGDYQEAVSLAVGIIQNYTETEEERFLMAIREYAYFYTAKQQIDKGEAAAGAQVLTVLLGELKSVYADDYIFSVKVEPIYRQLAKLYLKNNQQQLFVLMADKALALNPNSELKELRAEAGEVVTEANMIGDLKEQGTCILLLDSLSENMKKITEIGIENNYGIEYQANTAEEIELKEKEIKKSLPTNYKTFLLERGGFEASYRLVEMEDWIFQLYSIEKCQNFSQFLNKKGLTRALLVEGYLDEKLIDYFDDLWIIGRFYMDDEEFDKVELLMFDWRSQNESGELNTIRYTYRTDYDFDGEFHFEPSSQAKSCGFYQLVKDFCVETIQINFRENLT